MFLRGASLTVVTAADLGYFRFMRQALCTLMCLVFALACSAADPRPNIILIIADDMSPEDCGPYGNKGVQTPNLDRLAREGMRFTRAFVTTSSCSPSRS